MLFVNAYNTIQLSPRGLSTGYRGLANSTQTPSEGLIRDT